MWLNLSNIDFNPFFGCCFIKTCRMKKTHVISNVHFDYLMNGKKKGSLSNSNNKKLNYHETEKYRPLSKTDDLVNVNLDQIQKSPKDCLGTPYCDCYKKISKKDEKFISYENRNKMSLLFYLEKCIFEIRRKIPLQNISGSNASQTVCVGTAYCDCRKEPHTTESNEQSILNTSLLHSLHYCMQENRDTVNQLRQRKISVHDSNRTIQPTSSLCDCTEIISGAKYPALLNSADIFPNVKRTRGIWTSTGANKSQTNKLENDESDAEHFSEGASNRHESETTDGDVIYQGDGDLENVEKEIPYTRTICLGSSFCSCYDIKNV